ncbi:putative uncharacterized protein DDB_G0282133 isoform X2 [Tetranychus urticae]|uniref:putative uncharacterized protein DDB_G0282133 isoform X2 n=1 Tax=Tetranychus urticae TaxID=32264 RepID=UPI00077BB087|nr:putative uncharacterized protein DDB_G0282133 isoform X2 [Tetranychus urticae]
MNFYVTPSELRFSDASHESNIALTKVSLNPSNPVNYPSHLVLYPRNHHHPHHQDQQLYQDQKQVKQSTSEFTSYCSICSSSTGINSLFYSMCKVKSGCSPKEATKNNNIVNNSNNIANSHNNPSPTTTINNNNNNNNNSNINGNTNTNCNSNSSNNVNSNLSVYSNHPQSPTIISTTNHSYHHQFNNWKNCSNRFVGYSYPAAAAAAAASAAAAAANSYGRPLPCPFISYSPSVIYLPVSYPAHPPPAPTVTLQSSPPIHHHHHHHPQPPPLPFQPPSSTSLSPASDPPQHTPFNNSLSTGLVNVANSNLPAITTATVVPSTGTINSCSPLTNQVSSASPSPSPTITPNNNNNINNSNTNNSSNNNPYNQSTLCTNPIYSTLIPSNIVTISNTTINNHSHNNNTFTNNTNTINTIINNNNYINANVTNFNHTNHNNNLINTSDIKLITPNDLSLSCPILGKNNEAFQFLSKGAQVIVRMRGLPYDCTDQKVIDFFASGKNGCEVMDGTEGVLFVRRGDGRPTGDAFVLFESEEMAIKALHKHRESIGSRYIELFRSSTAEVQQVLNRAMDFRSSCETNSLNLPQIPLIPHQLLPSGSRRDCIRLRGLPYEAQVEQILEFLGEYANNIVFRGVHMVYNAQGQPSGEAFIQMDSEQSAAQAATQRHHKYMSFGKKQRYIEVFQCSIDDMNLVLTGGVPLQRHLQTTGTILPSPYRAYPYLGGGPVLPAGTVTAATAALTTGAAGVHPTSYYHPIIYWPYPSPPVSPTTYYTHSGPTMLYY